MNTCSRSLQVIVGLLQVFSISAGLLNVSAGLHMSLQAYSRSLLISVGLLKVSAGLYRPVSGFYKFLQAYSMSLQVSVVLFQDSALLCRSL